MKHLEPHPQLGGNQPAARTLPRKRSLKASFAIAALALVLGSGAAMTALFDPSPSDDVSESTKSRLIDEFAATRQFKLMPVPAGDIDAALDSMKLNLDQRNALKGSLVSSPDGAQARNTLGWIELWDFAAQDGDVVHLSSAGYEVDYPILNQPARLAIPVDATSAVTIRGVHDGGGGITLGIRSGVLSMSLPVIQPGQPLIVPITF